MRFSLSLFTANVLAQLHGAVSSDVKLLSYGDSLRSDGALYHRKLADDQPSQDNSILTITVAGQQPKNYSHSDALFGIPSYGGGITARLYYPESHDPSGCDGGNLTSDPNIPPQSVFLLDRGGCPFATKALNAQRAGAVGLVVIDNTGLCGRSPECGRDACSRCPLYGTSSCECMLPLLGDDGSSGGGITIPSMLIARDDGTDLRVAAAVGKSMPPHVLVNLRWDLPSPDDKVDWQLFHSPNDPLTYAFRKGITPYLKYVSTATNFYPRPYIFDGRAMGCSGPTPVFDCKDQCVNGGFYCAIDPDGTLDSGASGADVVMESLRSMCAFTQVQSDKDGGMKWWAYSDAFQSMCGGDVTPGQPAPWTDTCSYAAMAKTGIDADKVKKCVADSNSTVNVATGDYTNSVLQLAVNNRAAFGIVALPSVVVNGILLRGGTSPAAVLGAICAGYAAGTNPAVCGCLNVPVAGLDACVSANSGASTNASGSSLPTWAGVLIAFAVIGTAMALLASGYSYMQNRRMASDMVDLMDDYRSLVDDSGLPSGEPTAESAGPAGAAMGPGRNKHGRRLSRTRGAGSVGSNSGFSQGSGGVSAWLSRMVTPPRPGGSHVPATSASPPQFAGNSVV